MMRKATVLALCFVLAAGLVSARDFTVERFDMDVMYFLGGERDPGDPDCTMGNLNPPAYFYGWDWWVGPWENYAVYFNRVQADCGTGCSQSWALRNVTQVFYLDETSNFIMIPTLWAAVDVGGGCYKPGAMLYEGPTYQITNLSQLGGWTITLPFSWDGNCITPPLGRFFAGLQVFEGDVNPGFLSVLSDNAGVVGTPSTCYTVLDWGSGWLDFYYELGTSGSLNINTEIDCCWDSVPTEDASLSQIKGLFR